MIDRCAAKRHGLDQDRLAAFVARRSGAVDGFSLDVRPLHRGLQAAPVARVQARFGGRRGHPRRFTFVVKRLDGAGRRESAIYDSLLMVGGDASAPRVFGTEDLSPTVRYLYLEYVNPRQRWPWVESALAGLVLEQLACLHASLPVAPFKAALADWDYEAELLESAKTTLSAFETSVGDEPLAGLGRALPALRRTVAALPAMRRQLLAADPLGSVVLHGDAHPGNALIRPRRACPRAVLLDWGRARLGSPLEDVSSWLQSLAYREPEARRRHDTLLRRYLTARGLPTHLDRQLRDAYWLAAACNVLSGALRYHLAVAIGWGNPTPWARADAAHLVRDCLRIIRRADHCWRH